MVDYDSLMKSMDADAGEKIAAIAKGAEATAAEIRSRARARADEARRLHMDSAAKAVELEKNRRMFLAHGEAKRQAAGIRHGRYGEAFDRAKEQIASFRDSPDYPACLRKMAEEALEELGEAEAVLHVDPRDEALARRILEDAAPGCEIVADLRCAGGLDACRRDGRVVVHNTLESRLERGKRRMRLDIFAMLGGAE